MEQVCTGPENTEHEEYWSWLPHLRHFWMHCLYKRTCISAMPTVCAMVLEEQSGLYT